MAGEEEAKCTAFCLPSGLMTCANHCMMSYLHCSAAQHSIPVSKVTLLYQLRDFGKQDLRAHQLQHQHVAGSFDWVSCICLPSADVSDRHTAPKAVLNFTPIVKLNPHAKNAVLPSLPPPTPTPSALSRNFKKH